MEKELLLGRLIGLARATDGSEHLITPGSTALILECLSAIRRDAPLEDLAERITEEKRKMVPDCFLCANPCGRTDDYDPRLLRSCPEPLHSLKNALLERMLTDPVSEASLYRGLIALGMVEQSVIQAVLAEMNSTEG